MCSSHRAAGVSPRTPFPARRTLLAGPSGLVLGLASAALVATQAGAEDRVLAPVVVEATRLPGTAADSPWPVSVVEGDDVASARQGLGIDEALRTVPGLFAQSRYNFAQDLRLSIRGFGARSTFGIRGLRLLVDGVPATLADGQTTVDDLDLADLARIEVIRGPAASLYGASSGGVIRLVSLAPPETPEAGAGVASGSYGFAEQRLRAGGGTPAAAGVASASHMALDGARQQSRFERSLLRARARARLGSGELAVSTAVLDSPTAEDPGGLTAAERGASRTAAAPLNVRFHTGESVDQQQLGVGWRGPAAGGQLELGAYGLARSLDSRLPFQAVSLDRTAGGASVQLLGESTVLERTTTWVAGLEVQLQDDDRVRYVNDDGVVGRAIADQRETVTAVGAFVHARARLDPSLAVSAGLRADRVGVRVDDRFIADGDQSGDTAWSALSPSAGLVWTVSEPLDLYLNAATAFETPTTAELADPGGGGGINTSLEPQRALSLEAGLRGWLADGRLRPELALFHARVEDLLVARPVAGAPGRFAFENAGRATLAGLEAALAWDATDRVTLRGAWTWSRFRFASFTDATGTRVDGRTLPGIPRHVLAMEGTLRATPQLTLAADAQAVSARYADNANTAHSPGYVLVNARAAWAWSRGPLRLEASAGLDNLLGARYDDNVRINAAGGRYFEPAPERNAYAGASLTLQF